MFYVGQKVECIDDCEFRYARGSVGMDGLTRGAVYTVRAVGVDRFWHMPCIWLAEIDRPLDVGFHQNRFRPIVERKTDISIFTDMLTPKTDRVSA